VTVKLEMPALADLAPGADVLLDLTDLRRHEAAALWWVSNQSDDLLCLPSCRVRRLEYQVRTALRALGPLQGRALLSDEVGLGKTIKAGLIAKELCTRGMVRRMLVLTLPSLVDQWEKELADKFDLVVITTNHAAFAADPARVWAEAPMIVASLHTFKQAAQLAEAFHSCGRARRSGGRPAGLAGCGGSGVVAAPGAGDRAAERERNG